MALRLYRLLLVSAAVMAGSIAATIIVSGSWKAVAMAVALMAGSAVLTAVLVLGAMGQAPQAGPAALQRPQPARGRAAERAKQPEPAFEHAVPASVVGGKPAVAARPRPHVPQERPSHV
jgi:hypothetical protein